jgi:hypothetical protein
MTQFVIGLDLGQTQDPSALAILSRPVVPGGPRGQPNEPVAKPTFDVCHLQRWPLGTAYPQVVADVVKLLQAPALAGAALVVDQTGVGRAVVDFLANALRGQAACKLIPVTFTSGRQAKVAEAGGLRVPKRELVMALQTLLSERRLRIAQALPDAAALTEELKVFQRKITDSAHETFGAMGTGEHDDLVVAVALAAWWGIGTHQTVEGRR